MSGRERSGCCGRFRAFLALELHYTKLCFGHDDWRAFTYTPWLPYNWKFQWVYLIYRWIVMLYFSGWFLSFLITNDDGGRYLIYLTNWGFIVWNAYLIFAAISATVNFFRANFCCKDDFKTPLTYPSLTENISSQTCCGAGNWFRSLNDKIHWLLFLIGGEYAVGITLLFWIALYDPASPTFFLSAGSIHVHLVNGIISTADLFVTAIPVRIYHVLFTLTFSSAYVSFSGFYYLGNGTDPFGNPFIYPVLDYGSHPEVAAATAICGAIVLVVLLHAAFYGVHLLRHWLAGLVHKHYYMSVNDTTAPLKNTSDIDLDYSGYTDPPEVDTSIYKAIDA